MSTPRFTPTLEIPVMIECTALNQMNRRRHPALASRVKIEVFDLFGRRIRTLTDFEWPAGYHAVEWDGRDESGNTLRAGVFVYRMSAGRFREQRKIVITSR